MKPHQDSRVEGTVAKVEAWRGLSLHWRVVVAVLGAAGLFLAINQIFVLRLLGPIEFLSAYMYALLGCFLSVIFIIFRATKRAPRNKIPWYDAILFLLTMVLCAYLSAQSEEILHRGWEVRPPLHIGIAGILLCPLVLEALRRTGGMALFTVATVFAFYPTFANYMPGLLEGAQFSLWSTGVFHALSSSGILGILAQVFSQLVIGYILFGVVLVAVGAGDAFLKLAVALLGTRKGGPAKVAIFASAIFGTMSGSAVSNVITTGSFTIPTMKKVGYPPYFAGAVEAVASTGGVVMPPVMGAAAFIMASFLDISYFAVVKAAIIPSVLYYLSLYWQVHGYAQVHDLKRIPLSEVPPLKEALKETIPYLVGILALIYYLIRGLEAQAPFIASAVLLILAMLKKRTRLHFKDFVRFLQDASESVSNILGMIAGIGFMVGSMAVTGLGFSFASEIVDLAGGNVSLLLVFGALASFILGTGMTVTACYIFLAILMAPALINAGLNPVAVHLFVLYWGCASYITPPVALASITAAGIAGSRPFKTGLWAMRLGIVVYLVPFFFVAEPALILQGSLWDTLWPLSTCVVGTLLIASGLEGYLIKYGKLSGFWRIPMGVSGFLLMIPGIKTDIAGICLFLLTLGIMWMKDRAKRRRLG